jgi:hypothetical protein
MLCVWALVGTQDLRTPEFDRLWPLVKEKLEKHSSSLSATTASASPLSFSSTVTTSQPDSPNQLISKVYGTKDGNFFLKEALRLVTKLLPSEYFSVTNTPFSESTSCRHFRFSLFLFSLSFSLDGIKDFNIWKKDNSKELAVILLSASSCVANQVITIPCHTSISHPSIFGLSTDHCRRNRDISFGLKTK